MKVLVADDSKFTRHLVAKVLKGHGIQGESILEAEDGNQAFNIIKNNVIDLIVLDWLMPGMDGLQLVKKLKESPKLSKIPVIMMTVVSEYDKVHEALSYGIEDYIVKPLNENALWNRITGILTNNRKVTIENIDILKKEYKSTAAKEEYILKVIDSLHENNPQLIMGVHLFYKMFKEEYFKSEDDRKSFDLMIEIFSKRVSDKRSLKDFSEKLLED